MKESDIESTQAEYDPVIGLDQSNNVAARSRSRRFISLKWKSVVLVGIVLTAINVSLSTNSYWEQLAQFEQQRSHMHQNYNDALDAIINFKTQNLILAGDISSRLSGLREALDKEAFDQLAGAMEMHWPMFQFDLDVERLAIYQNGGQQVLEWNSADKSEKIDGLIQGWVNNVNQTKQPFSTIWCTEACSIFAVLPILTPNAQYVVALTQPLSNVIRRINSITGVDTGILVPENHKTHDLNEDAKLAQWKMHINALSGRQHNSRVLHQAAQQVSIEQLEKNPFQLKLDAQYFEVRLLPIASSLNISSGYWVTIDDNTTEIQAINKARINSLITGTIGLLVSGLLLTFILWLPMARLSQISQILPLLAIKAYETARHRLNKEKRSVFLGDDEIDQLYDSTHTLTIRLESLEEKVDRSIQALKQERDFVTNLMDSANVIIITQDTQYRITLINPYGEYIMGFTQKQIKDKSYCSLLDNKDDIPDLERQFSALVNGELSVVHHDSTIKNSDGHTCYINWIHSALEPTEVNSPAILSVGLDVTEQKQAQNRLVWLANYDSLTKLYNRHYFQEKLELVLAENQRSGRPGAVLYLDIDLFKDINDTSGHHAGDDLLIQVADILRHSLRKIDIIGRLGGDEFGIVLLDKSPEEAFVVAEKLNQNIARTPFKIMEKNCRISLSIGLITYPAHGNSVLELLANADLAMYQAKANGRGRCHMFSQEDQSKERLNTRIHWKERIEQALSEDRFYQCFQPILHIDSGMISHFEVLLRMLDQDGSTIPPGTFIRAAEQTGQIGKIDRMVLEKAIVQLADCLQTGQDVYFAINLSGTAFTDPTMLSYLHSLFDKTGVAPNRIILEITETAAVADLTAAEQMITDLRELGCRFSLDDFGVGFTSFTYLKRLPVDFIKIDGAFVRNLSEQSDDLLFVKSLAEIACGLGKKTVAEFVENEESLQILKRFGIDYAQGYHIGKPEVWDKAVRHLKVETE